MRFTSIEVCMVVWYSINLSVMKELFIPTYNKGAAGAVLLMRLMLTPTTLTLITFMIIVVIIIMIIIVLIIIMPMF